MSSTTAITDSTRFSVASSANNNAALSSQSSRAGCNNDRSQKKKKRLRFNLGGLNTILKRGRKRTLSETQLRKKVKKSAEKGDWNRVRKLIANYEFSAAMPKGGSLNPEVPSQEKPGRRPSYGSRTGERRSFTGGESAAAAAVIKAAMLDESSGSNCDQPSSSKSLPGIGDNILHDVCCFHPPLDVLETLLTALWYRSGSTFSTDEQGRTPLHIAAASGAAPPIIEALVRADPSPASTGDKDRRSPLHLAMRYLVNQTQEIRLSPEDAMEQTFKTVQILKDAMLTYPGKIDFKDKDRTGFSPLDYAIDGNITKVSAHASDLIETLIRRRKPRCHRSLHRVHGIPTLQGDFNRGFDACGRIVYSESSGTGDLDIDILEQLEHDEIKACSRRIEKIKAKRPKECINNTLYDVFGIQEQLFNHDATAEAILSVVTKTAGKTKPLHNGQADLQGATRIENTEVKHQNECTNDAPFKEPSIEENKSQDTPAHDQQAAPVMADGDIYNQHLLDYFDNMEDFDQYCDDEFDIFDDPEQVPAEEEIDVSLWVQEEKAVFPTAISFHQDDDCVSVMSGVTVPLML